MSYADEQIAVLTIAAEADSQPVAAQVAVGATLFNRHKLNNPKRYGSSIAGICVKRYQFSEWNDDVADNANLERVTAMNADHPAIVSAIVAYKRAETGEDPTNGATHFYADGIPKPSWAMPPAAMTVKLGIINFYKDVP